VCFEMERDARMFYLIFIVRGWPEGPCFNFSKSGLCPGSRPSEPITTPLRLCEAV
jgi:hypothetical protein